MKARICEKCGEEREYVEHVGLVCLNYCDREERPAVNKDYGGTDEEGR